MIEDHPPSLNRGSLRAQNSRGIGMNTKGAQCCAIFSLVPGAGIEPARLAAGDFEIKSAAASD